MSAGPLGALTGAGVCLLAAPYLARLTLSVPDRTDAVWWRGRPARGRRLALTALTALLLGGLAGHAAGWSALLPAFVMLALAATPLVLIDLEHHRLPDRLVFPAGAGAAVLLGVAALVRHDWALWLRGGQGAAAVFAVLAVLWLISPRSFGLGDVKLGAVLGAYLGWFGWSYVCYGIFAGFLLGTVAALALLASRRAALQSAIAFGPMLVLGALLAIVAGDVSGFEAAAAAT
ncbi:MAG: prepilin peptidase [Jatrophihabitantaceae bacterium]